MSGGLVAVSASATVKVFDLNSNRMHKAPELLCARAHHSSTVLGSTVYVYGGRTYSRSYEFIEKLDLETKNPGKWKAIDPSNKLPMLSHCGFCPFNDS